MAALSSESYCTTRKKLTNRQKKQDRKWEEERRMEGERVEDRGGEVQQWNQLSLLPQVTKTNLYKPRGKIDLADHPARCLYH